MRAQRGCLCTTAILTLTVWVPQVHCQENTAAVSGACVDLNRTVVALAANGRLQEARRVLSAASSAGAQDSEDSCTGLVLSNMAVVVAMSLRFAEAKVLADLALKALEKSFPPDDPVLLRPLQVLAASQFERGQIARAREAFRRMRSIRTQRPEDRALVHGMAAVLSQAEGRLDEAEVEYLGALSAWSEAGRGETVDSATILSALGSVYIEEQRFVEAARALDRAQLVLNAAKDALPLDRIELLRVRSALHAGQHKWPEAEQDLQDAIVMADRDSRIDPVFLGGLLGSYARVLRKSHHGREADSVEARAAALHGSRVTDRVVDVTELSSRPKALKK
jgi:tetratricopeptide (TPR) repeat protein